jgi:serine/threonine protein kinase
MKSELKSSLPEPNRVEKGPLLECQAIDSMLSLGPRRLTEVALCEIADHLDVCVRCGDKVDFLCPDVIDDEMSVDALRPTPTINLESRLVQEIVERLPKLQRHGRPLKLVRHPASDATPPNRSKYDGQLARGQVLRGESYKFVIGERIGFGDFTETYAARVVSGNEEDQDRRAVVKIPRLAEDMSSDAAIDRLRLLRSLIQVHAREHQNLANLPEVAGILDSGVFVHRLRDRETNSSFVAYAFIEGQDLAEYMTRNHACGGQFCGLTTVAVFAQWARMLAQGLLEIHNRLAIHGDVCPRNVLVTHDNRPVFIDLGESLFREVINGAKAFSHFYRAPEGIGTPSSDLFSLGGLLYFLATGQDPVGFAHTDREALKQQIAFRIKQANPELYHDDPGAADIIAMCLRKEERLPHARALLREIDAFWPEAHSTSVLEQLKSLSEPATLVDATGSCLYQAVATGQIRSFHRTLIGMTKGIFDADGSPADIRSAASGLLGALGVADEFLTVSVPAFWYPENIGVNGRFLSRCQSAAAHGAAVKRVFLLADEDLSNPHLEQIVAAHLNAMADLDASARANFSVRYVIVAQDERRKLVANGKHFGLLVKGGHHTAMWPVYDPNDKLVTLRFRSEPRQVEGLREAFEEIWVKARPLVDLRVNSQLDVGENVG